MNGKKHFNPFLLIPNQIQLVPKIGISLGLGVSFTLSSLPGFTLPLREDIPEEILRLEVITEARSSLDGKVMTADQYAALLAELQTSPFPPQLKPSIQQLIFLLQLRHLIRSLFPLF